MSWYCEYCEQEKTDAEPAYGWVCDAFCSDCWQDNLMNERDEARKLAAWLFQNYVQIGGLPKEQIRAMRKRYAYLKEYKGFYPESEAK